MEKYAVIMAGGAGSRLWPLSREKRPKQFIVVEDNKSMLLQTIERIFAVIPPENCFVITNKALLDITRNILDDIIPLANIIAEPSRKNTSACISYAALLLKKRLGNGLVCFVPADGYVKNKRKYKAALERAYTAAEMTKNLVVIGIKPTFPSSGYGYIHIGECRGDNTYCVRRFVEKPDAETAGKLFDSQEYLWNSGILAGQFDTICAGVAEHLPSHHAEITQAITFLGDQNFDSHLEMAYSKIPDISFDYGVLEKSAAISVVQGDFDWDDIGNLDALSKTFPSDKDGNLIKGWHLGINTSNSVIYSTDILVTTIGVDNMIVAVLEDAVLICRRDKVQDVKALVALLKDSGYEHLT